MFNLLGEVGFDLLNNLGQCSECSIDCLLGYVRFVDIVLNIMDLNGGSVEGFRELQFVNGSDVIHDDVQCSESSIDCLLGYIWAIDIALDIMALSDGSVECLVELQFVNEIDAIHDEVQCEVVDGVFVDC